MSVFGNIMSKIFGHAKAQAAPATDSPRVLSSRADRGPRYLGAAAPRTFKYARSAGVGRHKDRDCADCSPCSG